MTPAEEITAAADKLRAHASTTEQGLAAALREGTRDLFGKAQPDPAAMHPNVSKALAKWLENTAISLNSSTHPDWQDCVAPDALAVARAVLGSSDG